MAPGNGHPDYLWIAADPVLVPDTGTLTVREVLLFPVELPGT